MEKEKDNNIRMKIINGGNCIYDNKFDNKI